MPEIKLKPQDCVLLIKLLAHPERNNWSQRELASDLCMSLSEINAGIKRLIQAGLVRNGFEKEAPFAVVAAAEEFLIHGIKYSFPAVPGEYTRGIATGIAAPVFNGKVVLGNDPLPVWPYAMGEEEGVAVQPLYRSVPKALVEQPDQAFYDLLALVDVLRVGRARERSIAAKMIKEQLE